MTLIDSLYRQALRAYSDPRGAAADVLTLGVPREAVIPGLFLVVTLSVLFGVVSEEVGRTGATISAPLVAVLSLALLQAVYAGAVAKVGQAMGGEGTFADALLLAVFMQAMFLPAAVLEVVLSAISPDLAALFLIAVALFATWIQINFVAALHGFVSLGRAFVAFLIATVIASLVLMVIAGQFFGGPAGV